jgi:hypothetical protein
VRRCHDGVGAQDPGAPGHVGGNLGQKSQIFLL